jgi:hypothetical protein
MTMEGVSGKKNGIAQRAKSFGRLLAACGASREFCFVT